MSVAEDERLFLSVEEAGALLGVKRSRAQQMAQRGLIPTVRLGRRLLVPRRVLEVLADAAIERARELTNAE
jgi:excisionase family DNA binding protein